jgi:hypothetical protein
MSGRSPVKSAFQNLRPTIMREPTRSAVSPEAEKRLLATPATPISALTETETPTQVPQLSKIIVPTPLSVGPLLMKKKKERLLLVSFRMPQGLKEKLESVAKKHEINQTDIINEAIEMNLQRYL